MVNYRAFLLVVAVLACGSNQVVGQPGAGKPAPNYVSVKQLPRGHHRVEYAGKPYYFSGGRFYRPSGGVYVSISAPIGAVVPVLPGGFVTLGAGSGKYYFYAGVYYRPAPAGYVVVAQPDNAPPVLPVAEDSGRIIVYPAAGQTQDQVGRDRYECHLWASNETDYDPTMSDVDVTRKGDYTRAMTACLEARQYVVK